MEKINLVELLKDCPKGMELDCTMYDKVTLLNVDTDDTIIFPITIVRQDGNLRKLTKYGQYVNVDFAKCIIFPKGKTTWEGFQRPFKDGDIVAFDNPHRESLEIFIFKDKKENNTLSTCYLMLDGDELVLEEGMYYVTRLATEEEKQKLFKAIKENGYSWNPETKTLEKLVEPKFKVGDRIVHKNEGNPFTITEITDGCYKGGTRYAILITQQDNFELVPNKFDINSLKPFDKVLMRSSNAREWVATFYSHYSNNKFYGCGMCCSQCIPYGGNEHLLGKTNDCDEYFKTWK